jgi:hypothetical protein
MYVYCIDVNISSFSSLINICNWFYGYLVVFSESFEDTNEVIIVLC